MTITMPRGDIRQVNFTISTNDGSDLGINFSEIYFTVKSAFNKTEYVLQKRLSTGEIELMDNGSYQFTIESYDTDNLKIGRYVFDIEVVAGQQVKQTFVGDLILTNEVTFVENEA